MSAVERISVEVPVTIARAMRARVAAGRFASESEAVASALETVEKQERDLEGWLRGPVADAFDAVENDTATLFTAEEARARLRRRS